MSERKKLVIAFITGFSISIAAGLLTIFFPVLLLPWLAVKVLFLLVAIAEGVRTYNHKLEPLIEQKKLQIPKSFSSISENFDVLAKQKTTLVERPLSFKQIFSISTVVIALAFTALLILAPTLVFTISIYGILTRAENLFSSCMQCKQKQKDPLAISLDRQPLPQKEQAEHAAEQNQEATKNQNHPQNTANPETSEERPHNNPALTHNAMPYSNIASQTTTPPSNVPDTNTKASTTQPLVQNAITAKLLQGF